jgi:hypothetical protein
VFEEAAAGQDSELARITQASSVVRISLRLSCASASDKSDDASLSPVIRLLVVLQLLVVDSGYN